MLIADIRIAVKPTGMKMIVSGKIRPGSPRIQKHEGQRRADLQVKEGGFALGNFAAENQGQLKDFFEVDDKVMGEGAFGAVRRRLLNA